MSEKMCPILTAATWTDGCIFHELCRKEDCAWWIKQSDALGVVGKCAINWIAERDK